MRTLPRLAMITLLLGVCVVGCGRPANEATVLHQPASAPRTAPSIIDPTDRYVAAASKLGSCASSTLSRDMPLDTVCELSLSPELIKGLHGAYDLAAAGSELRARAYIALEAKRIDDTLDQAGGVPAWQDVRDMLGVAAADIAVGGNGSEASARARELYLLVPQP